MSTLPRRYVGWVGVQTPGEEAAVWMLRAILAERMLARREERVLFLPVGPIAIEDRADRIGWAFGRAWRLWNAS